MMINDLIEAIWKFLLSMILIIGLALLWVILSATPAIANTFNN